MAIILLSKRNVDVSCERAKRIVFLLRIMTIISTKLIKTDSKVNISWAIFTLPIFVVRLQSPLKSNEQVLLWVWLPYASYTETILKQSLGSLRKKKKSNRTWAAKIYSCKFVFFFTLNEIIKSRPLVTRMYCTRSHNRRRIMASDCA